MHSGAEAVVLTHADYRQITKEVAAISILQSIIFIIGIFIIYVIAVTLFHYARLLWRLYNFKKASIKLQLSMQDFISSLPPRESELCGDCKYSEVSKNSGKLLCLNEKSYYFGIAVAPEKNTMGMCYFERK